MKTGLQVIADERERQIDEEGYVPGHDDTYRHGELMAAACCYYIHGICLLIGKRTNEGTPPGWPWDEEWWKPTTALRVFAKAGALYKAQVDWHLRWYRRHGSYDGLVSTAYLDEMIEACAAEIDALQKLEEGGVS